MATITASLFVALDGVVDPGEGEWHFPYFNEQMAGAVDKTHDADVMLFGRVTYDSFAGAWPERGGCRRGRRAVRQAPGRHAEDRRHGARLVEQQLRATGGRPRGGRRRAEERPVDPADRPERVGVVVRQLLDAGLLDELHLFVHPATAGST